MNGTSETIDVFADAAIDPETRAFNDKLECMMAAAGPRYTQPIEVSRAERRDGTGIFPPLTYSERAEDWHIPGPAGQIRLRIFKPAGPVTGIYLHFHGGGWAIGGADGQDGRLETIADNCGLAVVSVEYRLAPEDPHPAAPDDCEAAALWLVAEGAGRLASERLLIGGESAGGHLAAVTLLRLRDRHGLSPFCGANLVYGVFDLNLSPSCRNWGERPLLLTSRTMQWFTDMFVPAGISRFDPDVSPLYGDLAGLPPALFTVGTLDPLLDDSRFMQARWQAAGNRSDLALYPGGIHGFNLMPIALAERSNKRIESFLRNTAA